MFSNDLDTVLNLTEKQNKKIENLENLNKHQSKDIKKAVDYTFELNKELEIKDKMIDELIPRVVLTIKENEEVLEMQSKSVNKSFIDCIKKYFRKKVED